MTMIGKHGCTHSTTYSKKVQKPQTWCDWKTSESNGWLNPRYFLLCKNLESSFSTFDSGIGWASQDPVCKSYVSNKYISTLRSWINGYTRLLSKLLIDIRVVSFALSITLT